VYKGGGREGGKEGWVEGWHGKREKEHSVCSEGKETKPNRD
jgi:hypothetical protein